MFVYIFAFALLVYFLYKQHNPRDWHHVKDFAGPAVLPIVGNFLTFINRTTPCEVTQVIHSWHEHGRGKSPVRYKVFGHYATQIFKCDQVEAILKSTTNISKGKPLYDFLRPWLGNALLTSTHDEWHRQRKALTPAYHFEILKQFMPIFDEHANEMVEWLAERQGSSVDIRTPVTLSTLDTICDTSMGKRLNALQGELSEHASYVQAILDFGKQFAVRGPRPWLHNNWIFYNLTQLGRHTKQCIELMHAFTNSVIKERAASFDPSDLIVDESPRRRRLAFLDLLLDLQRKGQMSWREVQEQTDTFMFEGHDTTATGIIWVLYLLACEVKHQRLVQEEIDAVLGSNDEITADVLAKMLYMDRCIKEAQRLYPSVPGIIRQLDEALELPGGEVIPADCSVEVYFFSMHRDPEQFADPDKFDPDRFLPENVAKRHPFAFTPFSGGPRNCIGQKFAQLEMKTYVTAVLRRFNMTCKQTPEEVQPTMNMVYRAQNPVLISFTSRN